MHVIATQSTNVAMWITFALICCALVLYAMEKLPVEIISIGILTAFMVYFHVFPIAGNDGHNLLSAERLIIGFANPALITVLALLVIGQGLARTGVLDRGARIGMAAGG